MMSQSFSKQQTRIAVAQGRRAKARRSRRGVSLFTVVLALMAFVVLTNVALAQKARFERVSAGRHMAEIAGVLAQTVESVVHEKAMTSGDPWSDYNTMPAIAGTSITLAAANMRSVAQLLPASWNGASTIALTNDLSARLYVVSVPQAPVATGLIVFDVTPDMHVLERNTFVSAISGWAVAAGESEEIVDVAVVFGSLFGRAPTVTEIPVMTFPFVTVEPAWVLREPMVGHASGGTLLGPIKMAGFDVTSASELRSDSGVFAVSGLVQTTVAKVGAGVVTQRAIAGAIDSATLAVTSNPSAQFAGTVESTTVRTSDITGGSALARDDSTGVAVAGYDETEPGSITGSELRIGTTLNSGSAVIGGPLVASTVRAGSALSTQARVDALLQVRNNASVGASHYATRLSTSVLKTNGCDGC